MTARIAITRHAAQRISERLEPMLGPNAEAMLVDAVLDAVWNHRFRRAAPKWLRAAKHRRGADRAYVVKSCAGVRFTAVVSTADPALPCVITVLTDRMAPRPLAAVPVLADGRVIGLPRTTPLPVAFQRVAA
jgi:hypothetical protein